MIPQDKNVRQLAWHLWYVEGSEIYCDNTEDDRNSVASQASCRMDVTRLEQCAYIKMTVLRGGSSVRKGIVPHKLCILKRGSRGGSLAYRRCPAPLNQATTPCQLVLFHKDCSWLGRLQAIHYTEDVPFILKTSSPIS